MLSNLIGKTSSKLYARKCTVKEVSGNDARDFLEINHRQGNTYASTRIGLYFQNELVSLMTFNKVRATIGASNDIPPETYELSRFCNKLNTNVVGSASRLFSHFVKNCHPECIISFSDRSHTRGNLYKLLGFTELRRSGPNYVWVDLKTNQAVHRANTQKSNLKKFLNDDSIDLTRTERQIMEEHGYVQVFDSGTITWGWRQ